MIKKMLAFLLCVLLLAGTASPAVLAAEDHSSHRTHLDQIPAPGYFRMQFSGRFFCEDCQQYYAAPITCQDIGMPILNIRGMLSIAKDNQVTVNVDYYAADRTFSSAATIKLQGASSLGYPKKNYTLQFIGEDGGKNKVCLADSWGKHSKYCLKANYVDASHARNIVSARLFRQIVHSRKIPDELSALPNGGVTDGYPLLVYQNGQLLGLYTMNIPKDNWMFGMKDKTVRQALLFADSWAETATLRQEIPVYANHKPVRGWKIEYCSTRDDPETGIAWVCESMNEFIRFLQNNDGEDFLSGISRYTDVDRAIDVLIFLYLIHDSDGTAKNLVWASYDGVKWIPSVYDLDTSWGMTWEGLLRASPTDLMPGSNAPYHDNLLFERLLANCSDRITARYIELREGLLSQTNILNEFEAFFAGIPPVVYQADTIRWPKAPSRAKNNLAQIRTYTQTRLVSMDAWFGVTVVEKTDLAFPLPEDHTDSAAYSRAGSAIGFGAGRTYARAKLLLLQCLAGI